MIYLVGEMSNGSRKLEDTYPRGIGRCYVERPIEPFESEPWFLDNGVFRTWNANGRNPDTEYEADYARFAKKLERVSEIADTSGLLFVVVPDRPGDAASLWTSLAWIDEWEYEGRQEELDPWGAYYGSRYGSIPLYLAVQDGMTPEELEEAVDVETDEPYLSKVSGLFLGGTDDFKNDTLHVWRELADRWGLKLHYARCTQSRIAEAVEAGCDSADSSHPNRLGGDRWARFLNVFDNTIPKKEATNMSTRVSHTNCPTCFTHHRAEIIPTPTGGGYAVATCPCGTEVVMRYELHPDGSQELTDRSYTTKDSAGVAYTHGPSSGHDHREGVAAFIAGSRLRLEEQERRASAERWPLERVEDLINERTYLRRLALDTFGVPCPACDGEAEVVTGELAATMTSPAEYVYGDCRDCGGRGKVMPEESLGVELAMARRVAS